MSGFRLASLDFDISNPPRIPDFGAVTPLGAIIVALATQVVKETPAQALDTFSG